MDDDLRKIVAEVLEIDEEDVHREMTPETVDLWDSMNHLRLITEVEEKYRIRLAMDDIQEIESLGDLADLVSRYGERP